MAKSAHNRTKKTEAMIMYNYCKTFFSRKRAEGLRAELAAQEIDTIIVSEQDYLNTGGTLYYMKWNKG